MTTTAFDQSDLAVGSEAMRFFPVEVATIEDGTLEMDVYLDSAGDGSSYVLYCAKGAAFTSKLREKLIPRNVRFLYVPMSQHKEYRKALARYLEKTYTDPHRERSERIRIVREACTKMIDDVLLFPERPESLETVKDVSRQFAEWVDEDQVGFSYLMDMATHDYYTVTHMVNVGVGCGLLAKQLKPDDSQWHAALIEGGLLHHVGKRRIPTEILNKEGKLSPEEWELVKSHPGTGFDLIKTNPAMSQIVMDMVHSHHERFDGAGYPIGLAGEQISEEARICSVIDVFDAICAARPYRGPLPPEQTLKVLAEGKSTCFDPEMVDAWDAIVRGLLEADPQRVPPQGAANESLSLDSFVQQSPSGGTRAEPINRRRHPRFECCLNARARWLDKRTEHPGKGDMWAEVIVLDISQGGARISMALPIEVDEVLELEVPAKGRPPVRRVGRIVHVATESGPRWRAGMVFL
ncbi:MAG TPA: HD domain-containing phosphohydrolase [Phycisphaerae bacterium]|nr:HD domain-containing phosphohydrolase [Phycisphaerae bacterium]HRR84416.1 HD domain-containing phosphohydrolase [Phycisphaerae bacterium]